MQIMASIIKLIAESFPCLAPQSLLLCGFSISSANCICLWHLDSCLGAAMVHVCRLEATFLQMGFSVSPEIDKL